jgi:hypothetical protein
LPVLEQGLDEKAEKWPQLVLLRQAYPRVRPCDRKHTSGSSSLRHRSGTRSGI